MKQKLHNPRGLIIPWVIAILVFAGYAAYWNMAADRIEKSILSQNGKSITFSKIEVSGFPIRFKVRAKDFSLSLGNAKLNANEIALTSRPMSPYLWVLDNIIGASITDSLGAKTNFVPQNIRASVRFGDQNSKLNLQRLSLEAAQIQFPSSTANIDNLKFHLIGDEKSDSIAFSFEAQGLGRIEPFKSNNFQPEILRGLIPNAKLFETSFQNWREKSGYFDIKYGFISFQRIGPLGRGEFDNLNGQIAINKSGNFDGILIGNANLTIFSDKKLGLIDFKVTIKDSQLDVEQTLRDAIMKQIGQ